MTVDLSRALQISETSSMFVHDLRKLAELASGCKQIIELGSFHGRSARAMLDSSRARIWCVDVWNMPPGRTGRGVSDEDFQTFLGNIEDVRSRVAVLRMLTDEAAGLLPEESFDLVFIDADHRYEAVRSDILNYAPLLKYGGILCGHDYGKGRDGLIEAVNETVRDPLVLEGGVLWWTYKLPGWLRISAEVRPASKVYRSE